MDYLLQLSTSQWDSVRKLVYKRADYRCQLCGDSYVKLNAHHSFYDRSLMAWEYPLGSMIALCDPCHSKAAHGNPDEAIRQATEDERSASEVTKQVDQNFLAYIIYHHLQGKLTISGNNFSPLDEIYSFERSYDDASDEWQLSARDTSIYDGSFAYRIRLSSRDNIGTEIAELVAFAKDVHEHGLSRLVQSAFYDSKTACCELTLDEVLTEKHNDARMIFDSAVKTLGSFWWFGVVHHGTSNSDAAY